MANQYLTLDDPRYNEEAARRFWLYVDTSGGPDSCWPWKGGHYPNGYGKSSYMGTDIGAHRLSWIVHFGPIPNSVWVLHKCDNRWCNNPSHLFLGTPTDNQHDRNIKGRGNNPCGENAPNVKLSNSDIFEIRSLRSDNLKYWTHRRLAAKFGVSNSNISNILNRHSWKHI